MPRTRGKSGDFHQGVPDKHLGNKGDRSDQIRSSTERRRAEERGFEPETSGNSASPRAVKKRS